MRVSQSHVVKHHALSGHANGPHLVSAEYTRLTASITNFDAANKRPRSEQIGFIKLVSGCRQVVHSI